jgi:hypothetical protein
MKRMTRAVGLVLAVIVVCAIDAVSTEIVLMTPRDLGMQATIVVRGSVRASSSSWNESRTKIFTKTTIDVAETYKGERAPSVEVTELGGVVDNVKMTVSGAVLWKKGEEVLLFLESGQKIGYQIVGLSQGKFTVERDPVSGKRFLTRAMIQGQAPKLVSSGSTAVQPPVTGKVGLERFIAEALGKK